MIDGLALELDYGHCGFSLILYFGQAGRGVQHMLVEPDDDEGDWGDEEDYDEHLFI